MRYWQLDFSRGIAIILMIVFNYAFALSFLGVYYLDWGWLFWFLFPRFVAGMFILIAGISLAISISRQKKYRYKKYFLRGAKLFCIGLAITAVSWLLFSRVAIIFGILHLIGIAVILGPFFRKWKRANLAIGVILIFLGVLLANISIQQPWLLWLGLPPEGFATLDYFPLLPWLGVFIIGMFLGGKLLEKKVLNIKTPVWSKAFCFLGRHSLIIYILHQPVLVGVLYLTSFVAFPF